jgi:hypothetical protein
MGGDSQNHGIAQAIDALRQRATATAAVLSLQEAIEILPAHVIALCDAAEAGLRAEKPGEGATHYDGCWRYHHACAVARIERERRCCDELRAVTAAADDPRINLTITLEEWAREKAGLRCASREQGGQIEGLADYLRLSRAIEMLRRRFKTADNAEEFEALAVGTNAAPINGGGLRERLASADWRALVDKHDDPPSCPHGIMAGSCPECQINEGGQERSTVDNPERNVPVPPSPASPLPDDRYCWHAWKYDARNAGCVVNCGKPRATLSPSPHDDTDEGTCAARTVNRSTPSPDAALVERLRAAQDMIGEMCALGRPPKMSIPARPDYDEDLLICATLKDAAAAITRLTAELAEARQQRDQYHDTLVAKHGGEPIALLAELDDARAECERLRALLNKHDDLTYDTAVLSSRAEQAEADAERYWPFVEMVARGRYPSSNDILDAMEMERGRMRAAIGAGRKQP